jgi:hypothetical protein
LLTQIFLSDPLSDYSRNFAIRRSDALISAIENYKDFHGQYPESIDKLKAYNRKKIVDPFIMGIRAFRYNRIDDHYSISFSQWLKLSSLEEIVLYDKSNLKNSLTSDYAKYDYGVDLFRVKGAFASRDTKYDHWRYYYCD